MSTPTPTPTPSETPSPTVGLTLVPAVTLSPKQLFTWGTNTGGQLANNSTSSKSVPTQVVDVSSSWVFASASTSGGIAIKSNGTLWTWGVNNFGQLGTSNTTNTSSMVQTVAGGTNWYYVNCSGEFSAAIKSDGSLWLWGSNIYGQIGDGTVISRSSPIQISGNWYTVAACKTHLLAIKNDGTLWAAGDNQYGTLGNEDVVDYSSIIQIGLDNNWVQVVGSLFNSAAIKSDGTLWTWGANFDNTAGTGTGFSYSSPVQTALGGNDWSSISTDGTNVFALKTNGSYWIFGSNIGGSLGTNNVAPYLTPAPHPILTSSYDQISESSIRKLASVFSWSANAYGQVGNNSTISTSSPQQIGTGVSWSLISKVFSNAVGLGDLLSPTPSPSLSPAVTNSPTPSPSVSLSPTPDPTPSATQPTPTPSGSPAPTPSATPIPCLQITSQTAIDITPITGDGYSYTNQSYTTGGATLSFVVNCAGDIRVWCTINGGSSITGQIGIRTASSGIVNYLPIDDTTPYDTTLTFAVGGLIIIQFFGTGGPPSPPNDANGEVYYTNLPTVSPTASPVPTASPTPSPSISPTVTESPTPSPSISPTVTESPTPSTSLAPTSTPVPTNSPTPSPSISPTVTVSPTPSPTNSPTPSGTGVTPTPTPSATALPFLYGMKLWLWGDNTDGQLGDGTVIYRSSPVQTLVSGQVWWKVSLGSLHAGGILYDYSLWTWGRNNYGQLGDGTILNRSSPVNIGTDSWLWVSCGYESSAGIKTDGSLWLWGLNSGGQLGTQNIINYSSPVQVYGENTNWKSVSVGYNHTAAIKNNGSLWTWGQNSYGQLGSDNLTAFSSPIQTALGGNYWIAVSAGANFSLAVKNDGTIWGFGLNAQGQLGDGNNANLSYPTQIIQYGSTWLNAAAGFGFGGAFGNLGSFGTPTPTPSPSNSLSPTPTPSVTQPTPTPLPTIVSKLFLWGSNNFGQLGDNTTIGRNFPAEVFGDGTNWSKVSAGYRHFGGLKADGTMYMWGYGAQGQLAQDNITTISTPIQNIITNRVWVAIACGRNFTGGLETGFIGPTPSPTPSPSPSPSSTMTPTPSGTGPTFTPTLTPSQTPLPTPVKAGANLWAWGRNSYGQIGDGNFDDYSLPVLISSTGDWESVGAGMMTSFAVKKDGTLWSWGSNVVGQTGQDSVTYSVSVPTQVGTDTNWSELGWCYDYATFIKADGTLWFWGNVVPGNNTSGFASSPTQVGTSSNWISVTGANVNTVHAVKSDGTLWAWGSNGYGLFGNGTQSFALELTSSIIQIGNSTNWLNVGAGTLHVLAVKNDGTLWTWGNGLSGQLGNGLAVNQSSPVQVGTDTDWSHGVGGHVFSIAIKNNGTVWTWGGNYYGELAQNDQVERSSPVQLGTSSDYRVIAGSAITAAVIKNDNTLWMWGLNSQGQAGVNYTTPISSPVQVAGQYYDVAVSTMTLAIGVNASPLPTATITVSPTLTPSPTPSPTPDSTPTPTPAPLSCVEYHDSNLFDVTIVGNKYIYTNKEFTVGDLPFIEFWTTGYGENNNEIQLNCGPAGLNAYRVQVSTDGSVGYNGPCGGPIYVLGYSIPNGAMRIDIVSITNTVPAGSIVGIYYIENCGPTPTIQPTFTPSNTDPTPTPSASPMPTPSPTPSAAIMYIWGNNAYGQLGQGNVINYSSPVNIGGTSAIWTYLAGGGSNFGATKKDGSLWVWGENYQGQLANNNLVDYSSMIQVGSNFDMWNFVGFGGNNIGGFGGGIKNPIPSSTPNPTNPTPTPTLAGPTATPYATAATATPTGTPLPSRTPLPTAGPTRTQLPTASPTPSPTMSPTPSPTPSGTGATPTPTGTEPTATPTFAPTLPPQTTPPAGASWICFVDGFGFESRCLEVAQGTGNFLTYQDCLDSGCGSGYTPTSTPTQSPVPTATPLPTGTEPTATPESTDPSPTPTATPTFTPAPSNTDPTLTPAATSSPTPTSVAFNLLFMAWG